MLVEGWKTLHLWDLAAGKEVRQLQGHEQGTRAVAFSPDGKTLVTGGRDGIIQIQEVATSKILAHFPCRHMNDQVNGLAISPDGTILASGGFEPGPLPVAGKAHTFFASVRLWDMKTGESLGRLQGGQLPPGDLNGVRCLAFSPDGKTLASACGYLPWTKTDTSIRLWDLASRQEVRRLEGCEGGFYALAFSPNSKALASAGNDRSVRLWEVATGKERCRFLGHQGWVPCVAFSADGKALVSCSADTTVMVWAVMRAIADGKDDSLSAEDLQSLWTALAADDAGRAYQAMCRLVAAGPQGILLLKDGLQPDRAPDRQRLAQLFANLDSESFDRREKATRELEQLGDLAGPALKKILEDKPTLEVRRRVERLLGQLEKGASLTPDRLRAFRGIEVLEQIGSFDARQVLEGLGRGAPGSQVTTEAQLALRRLVSTSNP